MKVTEEQVEAVLKGMVSSQISKIEQLIALASDGGTSLEERRTAAFAACQLIGTSNLFSNLRKVMHTFVEATLWIHENKHALNRMGAKL